MSSFFVGGAIVASGDDLLLVRNNRSNGVVDWTPPGGVIDKADGGDVCRGIAREVNEETGLTISTFSALCYSVHVVAPKLGWEMTAQVYEATHWAGTIDCSADPDGIVSHAEFVSVGNLAEYVSTAHRWVHEPLLDFLDRRYKKPEVYEFTLEKDAAGVSSISRV